MNSYTNPNFWKAAAERSLRTLAQTAVALLGADGLGVLDVDWGNVGSVAGLAAVASVLTSVASAQVGDSDGPSVGGEQLKG